MIVWWFCPILIIRTTQPTSTRERFLPHEHNMELKLSTHGPIDRLKLICPRSNQRQSLGWLPSPILPSWAVPCPLRKVKTKPFLDTPKRKSKYGESMNERERDGENSLDHKYMSKIFHLGHQVKQKAGETQFEDINDTLQNHPAKASSTENVAKSYGQDTSTCLGNWSSYIQFIYNVYLHVDHISYIYTP